MGGSEIEVDQNAMVYVSGYFKGGYDFDPGPGYHPIDANSSGTDIFLAKFNGSLLPTDPLFYQWAFSIGRSGDDAVFSMELGADNKLYMSGSIGATTDNLDFDPSINNSNHGSAPYGANFLLEYDVALTSDNVLFYKWAFLSSARFYSTCVKGNTLFVAGTFAGQVDFDPSVNIHNFHSAGSHDDIFFGCYSTDVPFTDGSFFKWFNSIGNDLERTSPYYEPNSSVIEKVITDSSGNIYAIGTISGQITLTNNTDTFVVKANGLRDVLVVKYKPNGEIVWAFSVGGDNEDQPGDIKVDSAGMVYLAANMQSYNTAQLDMDPSSNNYIFPINSGSLIVAKYDGNKLPSDPSFFKYAFSLGTSCSINTYESKHILALDKQGALYLTGSFNVSNDFDPSSNSYTISGAGSTSIFVAKYDGAFTPNDPSFFKWAFSLGSSNQNEGSIALDKDGLIYITGDAGPDNIDFDPSSNTQTGTSNFIASYDGNLSPSSTSFFKAVTAGLNYHIYDIAVSNKNLYVTGNLYSSTTYDFDPSAGVYNITSVGSDIFLAKYDLNFSPSNTNYFKWAFGLAMGTGYGRSLAVDKDEMVYLIGDASLSSANFIDMDPSANYKLIKVRYPVIVVAKYDGNKLPSDTRFCKWAFGIGSPTSYSNYGYTIAVDSSRKVILGGQFFGPNIDFNPTFSDSLIMSSGQNGTYPSAFIAKYNSSEAFEYVCPGGNSQLAACINVAGNTYQWQADTTTGWFNLSDDVIYSGTQNDTLNIISPPTTYYGYKYRCLITNTGRTSQSITYILKFATSWLGTNSTAWEDPSNWSCGMIPDGNTDVFVEVPYTRNLFIHSFAICRSITVDGKVVTVYPPYSLTITH